jgi:hypothetical protein
LSRLDKLLDAKEKVIWSGKPVKKAFVLPGLFSIPFGLVFLGFAIFWMWGASSSGASNFFTLFGLPFVLVAFGIIFAPSKYCSF